MIDNIRDRITPGDRARLRCGGILTARMTTDLVLGCRPIKAWHDNGSYAMPHGSDFDIVGILPRPLTDAERLAKIAGMVKEIREFYNPVAGFDGYTKPLERLLDFVDPAPPARLDPGRDVTDEEWDRATGRNTVPGGLFRTLLETATEIVRARLAEAETQPHE